MVRLHHNAVKRTHPLYYYAVQAHVDVYELGKFGAVSSNLTDGS